MRVPEFGGDVEAEVVGVLDGAVSETDADGSTGLEGLFEQEGLQDWIQLLSHIFQENLSGTKWSKNAPFVCSCYLLYLGIPIYTVFK